MRRPVDPETFTHLVVTHGDHGAARMLPAPRPARVRAQLYDGTAAVLELDVVARAKGFVCVRQERPGQDPWLAWVPQADAVPR